MHQKIDDELKLDFNDVLIKPKASDKPLTRKDVTINVDYGDFKGFPLIIANMLSIGTYNIANVMADHGIPVFLHKEYTLEEHLANWQTLKKPHLAGVTSGVQPWDKKKTVQLCQQVTPGFINVDIANTYANVQGMCETLALYRQEFPNIKLVAGNVCDVQTIDKFVEAGADIIKIGVGPGAACKTRSEVGVGIPQLSAVLQIAEYCKNIGVRCIADGGGVTSGDVCKAFAAGADYVMRGGMVSGSQECDNIVKIDNKQYVNFFGLGSNKQYELTKPSQQEYRPNEGRNLLVPVTGSIVDVTNQIKGAVRSVCTYTGIDDIKDLYHQSTFIRVNHQINKSLAKYDIGK